LAPFQNHLTPGGQVTQWALSVTITANDFYIENISLQAATPGSSYGPVSLSAANVGQSEMGNSTTLKWRKVTLPKGLKLSTSGVLSGNRVPSCPIRLRSRSR
jgi:hypothetical protein